MKINNKYSYLPSGAALYRGLPHEYVLFTEEHQLKSRATWDKFVEVFTENADDHDRGWRCEYWGKMMRGASLIYTYHPDEELYSVLEYAVRRLFTTQRPDGRISTYSEEAQFSGWDMWGRKYILTGAMHFYRICKDGELKEQIIKVLSQTADHIVAHIGPGEGQKSIFETSNFWLGVNSCSILEPFIELYTLTGKQSYLDFAEYIISLGGCSGGNLIQLALEDELAPYQYPQTKAYETMSFFEGVLAYYQLTGEEKYLEAVLKFTEQVFKTDVTLIGCSGCTHELFDNSGVKQTEWSEIHMQETCVTVTWMRLLARLHLLTGDPKYADRIEASAYNALYGSVNTEGQQSYSKEIKSFVEPMPFDSYSPLYNNKRGLATGGFKRFRTGGYYGCCCCIAAAGIALFPLQAVMAGKGELLINSLLSGEFTADGKSGTLRFLAETEYPKGGTYKLTLAEGNTEGISLRIRIPLWAEAAKVSAKGKTYSAKPGYFTLPEALLAGDAVTVELPVGLRSVTLNGKTAYLWGSLVLGRDAMKDGKPTDKEFKVKPDTPYTLLEEKPGELLRLELPTEDGRLLLCDYQSCGKKWCDPNAFVSVWLNAK